MRIAKPNKKGYHHQVTSGKAYMDRVRIHNNFGKLIIFIDLIGNQDLYKRI